MPIRMVIDAESVPCNPGSNWRGALGDGEDYELLFCCRSAPPESVLGVPISVIGRVESSASDASDVVCFESGAEIDIDDLGWEHRARP